MKFIARLHSKSDRLMISQNLNGMSFKKIVKVADGKENSNKFTTEGIVLCLSRLKLLKKRRQEALKSPSGIAAGHPQ